MRDGCEECPKSKYCDEPCLYISVMRSANLTGISLRESISPPEGREEQDYKKTLAEVQEGKESRNKHYIDKIKKLKGRKKLIATMILCEVSIAEIAELLDITERRVYQIIKG